MNKSILFYMSLIIGLLVLAAQIALSFNTMSHLSVGLPFVVSAALIALVVLFECVKTLVTFFIRYCGNGWAKLGACLLLGCLSGASVFSMRFTVNYAVGDKLSLRDEMVLASLNKYEDAYLGAVSNKGVITATDPYLKEIKAERAALLSSDENYLTRWADGISILTEVVIIACFSMAAFFHDSAVAVKSKNVKESTGIQLESEEIQQEYGEIDIKSNTLSLVKSDKNLIDITNVQITKLMKQCNLSHPKAKEVLQEISKQSAQYA